jgi:hypothetical protein
MRRQLTLLLPPEQRVAIDCIRQRLDPLQHARIPAHVTLCRDEELEPWGDVERRLERLGSFAIDLRFGAPESLPDGCILLRPVRGIGRYRQLRRSILGPSAREHGAHITLLHPRNAHGVECDMQRLGGEVPRLAVVFRAVSLIEQEGDAPWQVRRHYGAAA